MTSITVAINRLVEIFQNWPNRIRTFALPVATENSIGGVKVGNNLSVDENGTLVSNNEAVVFKVVETVDGTTRDAEYTYVGCSHSLDEIVAMYKDSQPGVAPVCVIEIDDSEAGTYRLPATMYAGAFNGTFYIDVNANVDRLAVNKFFFSNYTIIQLTNTKVDGVWGEMDCKSMYRATTRGAVVFNVDPGHSTKKVSCDITPQRFASIIPDIKSKKAGIPDLPVAYITRDSSGTIYCLSGELVIDNNGYRVEVYREGSLLGYITIENNAWVWNTPPSSD